MEFVGMIKDGKLIEHPDDNFRWFAQQMSWKSKTIVAEALNVEFDPTPLSSQDLDANWARIDLLAVRLKAALVDRGVPEQFYADSFLYQMTGHHACGGTLTPAIVLSELNKFLERWQWRP